MKNKKHFGLPNLTLGSIGNRLIDAASITLVAFISIIGLILFTPPAPAGSDSIFDDAFRTKTASVVVQGSAGTRIYTAEIAASKEDQEHGLMNRDSLPTHSGMIFIFPRAGQTAFWMKNTKIPLDIVFIKGGKIANIAKGIPFDETHLLSEGPVDAVLEVNAGEMTQIGAKKGDIISY